MYTTETLVFNVRKYCKKEFNLIYILSNSGARVLTYQICDISDLDGIVNNLSSGTTVSFVKLYTNVEILFDEC